MKRIKGFSSFNESVMLQMINETALYFLPKMRKALAVLSNDGNDIAYRLLLKVGVDTFKDITLVDLEDDKLSFMSKAAIDSHDPEFMKKLDKGYEITNTGIGLTGDSIKRFKNRNQMKIGKFVTSVLGTIPPKELEEFVNKLKSKKNNKYEITVVEGDEIKKYYKTEALVVGGSQNPNLSYSEIMRSCMRDKEKVKPNVFDIYTKNPESCKMLIMLDENKNLVSRAILWKVNNFQSKNEYFGGQNTEGSKLSLPESFWFMDRVYSVENWMDNLMYDWATKKGYACKRGNWGNRNISFNGVSGHCEMEVDVKKIGYKGFPYMDTFTYYDVKNGKLRNFGGDDFKGFGLQSTAGNYGTTTGHGPVIRNYIRRFTK
jgi:hypothetical protein